MPDIQETECIITAFLSLRNQRNGRCYRSSSVDQKENANTDPPKKETKGFVPLPDAIIRDGILSYRPFRSFRVVLIRGESNVANPFNTKHEYSLTFGTNRGPLRFRVVEHPYLPPHSKCIDAELYRGADGVVISCYMRRFFDFCNRYGYHYASSSIFRDVQARQKRLRTESAIGQEVQGEREQAEDNYPRSVVLCGNNVDITHVDARLSSIVFWHDTKPKNSDSEESESIMQPPNSHIETPRHPFASLARNLTNDYGLEFFSGSSISNPFDREYTDRGSLSTNDPQQYEKWNHDDDPRNWNWLRAQVS